MEWLILWKYNAKPREWLIRLNLISAPSIRKEPQSSYILTLFD